MKQAYWIIIGITIVVIFTVLFVPGVAQHIERTLLSSMVNWAS